MSGSLRLKSLNKISYSLRCACAESSSYLRRGLAIALKMAESATSTSAINFFASDNFLLLFLALD